MRESRRERSMVNHESYRIIYSTLAKNLRHFARSNPNSTAFKFEVPPFILGRPLYDRAHAVRYVFEKAVRHGYSVSQTGNGAELLLDWTPLPVHKKPLDVRRAQAAEAAGRDRRIDLRSRKERAEARRAVLEPAGMVMDAVNARDAAEGLNDRLEALLKKYKSVG
jgi:hypothetical protein